MRSIRTLSSHIATATLAIIIGGGVMSASATTVIDDVSTEPVPAVASQKGGGGYGPDFSETVCATAPASNKYELFQSPNYVDQSYAGSNDRMLANMVSTAPQNVISPTYSYNLEVTTNGRLWVTEVWYCATTVTMVATGEMDEYGYPAYDFQVSDAQWVTAKVARDRHNRSLYIATPPASTYSYDPLTGTNTSTYPVNYYIVGKGHGKTVPSIIQPYGPPPQK